MTYDTDCRMKMREMTFTKFGDTPNAMYRVRVIDHFTLFLGRPKIKDAYLGVSDRGVYIAVTSYLSAKDDFLRDEFSVVIPFASISDVRAFHDGLLIVSPDGNIGLTEIESAWTLEQWAQWLSDKANK